MQTRISELAANLRRLRTEAGLSQRAVDAAAGIATGTTARLEGGRSARPPTYDLCQKLDEAIGVPVGTLWRFAAPARLLHLDPHAYAWLEERVAMAHGLKTDEVHLVEELRAMDQTLALRPGSCAEALGDVLMIIGAEADVDGRAEVAPVLVQVLEAMGAFSVLPIKVQLQALRAIVATLDLASLAATEELP